MEPDEKKPKRQLPFRTGQLMSHLTDPSVVTIELSDDEELPAKRLKLPVETVCLSPDRSESEASESDWTAVRCRCEAEEVPEKFLTLVSLCSTSSPASEFEVLSHLLSVSGDVKATICYFRKKRPHN